MKDDNEYKEMRCVIYSCNDKKKTFRVFQDKRIEMVMKQIRGVDMEVLKNIDMNELPEAA